jgi:poly(3-hydroxybutyrate) depolymerase
MKLLTKLSLTAIALLGSLPATFAGPRAERARHEAKRQAQREESAEKTRRWSHYLTDEGALGPIGWKEYTVNPNAKGTPSLVVVLGGRDAAGDGPRPTQPPPALDPLINFAKTGAKGKTIILVPQLPLGEQRNAGRRPARGGPGAPNGTDKLPELVRARAEKHGIPPLRVFATGVSMGGHVIYGMLVSEPMLFSRAVIVSAVGDTEKAGDIKAEVRAYHGANDDVIAPGRAKSMVDAINAKNPGRASLVQLKGKAHRDAAEAAYGKSDCWKWLLR